MSLTLRGYDRINQTHRRVMAHVLVAEAVLGRRLPSGVRVHHVNGVKADNRPGNLVICENQAYHLLLHRRQRALDECGDARKVQCQYCRQWRLPDEMQPRGRSQFHHRSCAARWQREYRSTLPPRPTRTPVTSRATESHCRYGHPWTIQNLHVTPAGSRVCRQCDRERRNRTFLSGVRE